MSELSDRVEVVRGHVSEALANELVRFWADQGALSVAAARQRLVEVVCVLRDPSEAVVGVNSVYADRVELIGGRRFWIYRSFISAGSAASWPAMVDAAFAALEEEFRATGEGPIGLCVLVSDLKEMRRRPEAVWPGTGFIYAGYDATGAQARIAYFEGATIGAGANEDGEANPRLQAGYRIETFPDQDEIGEQDVLDLWRREGVVDEVE